MKTYSLDKLCKIGNNLSEITHRLLTDDILLYFGQNFSMPIQHVFIFYLMYIIEEIL